MANPRTDATDATASGVDLAKANPPLPARERLPKTLQKIVDQDDKDSIYEDIYDGV